MAGVPRRWGSRPNIARLGNGGYGDADRTSCQLDYDDDADGIPAPVDEAGNVADYDVPR